MPVHKVRRKRIVPKQQKEVARMSKPVRTAMARVAKRVMKGETKYVTSTLENLVGHNSSISSGDAITLIPQLSQGVDDTNRLGNKISPTGLYVKGKVAVTGGLQTNNKLIWVRVMVVSQKNIKDSTAIGALFSSDNLLKANDTSLGLTNTAYNGSAKNSLYPANKELFSVHYMRDFKVTPSSDYGTGPTPPVGYEMNSRSSFKWGCKVKLPAALDYNAGTATYPVNAAPFLLIGYCYADGTAPDVLSTRITSTTISTLYFKDL